MLKWAVAGCVLNYDDDNVCCRFHALCSIYKYIVCERRSSRNPHPIFTKCCFLTLIPKLTEVQWHTYASVNWTIIGLDNDLIPVWCQAIIWTDTGLLLIGLVQTNFNGVWIEIKKFLTRKYVWKGCLQTGHHFVVASRAKGNHSSPTSC